MIRIGSEPGMRWKELLWEQYPTENQSAEIDSILATDERAAGGGSGCDHGLQLWCRQLERYAAADRYAATAHGHAAAD